MKKWIVLKTVLIVGEGYADEAFLNYVKSLFSPRGNGLKVTIKNAKGKGAEHVIDYTERQTRNAQYDKVATLLDTDTDWTIAVEKKAKKHKIEVLKSESCFERMLLRVLGESDQGNIKEVKKYFTSFVNNDSTKSNNYAKYFTKEVLLSTKELAIINLLKLFDQ